MSLAVAFDPRLKGLDMLGGKRPFYVDVETVGAGRQAQSRRENLVIRRDDVQGDIGALWVGPLAVRHGAA